MVRSMSRIGDEILDARADQALARWIAWLPGWTPEDRGDVMSCAVCVRYVEVAGLGDLPHDVVHVLTATLDLAVRRESEQAVIEGRVASPEGADAGAIERVSRRVAAQSKAVERAVRRYVRPSQARAAAAAEKSSAFTSIPPRLGRFP